MSAVADNIASDLIKIGISALIAKIAAVMVGGYTTVACAPIIAIIGVSIFVGAGLNWAGDRFNLTEKLIAALEDMGDEVKNMVFDAESTLYRGTREFFSAQGLTLPKY